MQVLVDFASHVDVPAADVADGSVFVPPRSAEQERMFPRLLHVHCCDEVPPRAFVSVRYRDQWFWIDDRDARSKAALNFLLMLFSLTETATTPPAVPIVTIPSR